MIHKGNVAPPRRRLLVGCGVRAGSRTITAVTYHHSVWLRQWHSGTPPGKNDAFIQLVSPDQAGHDRSDKTTFCVRHKKKKKKGLAVLNVNFFFQCREIIPVVTWVTLSGFFFSYVCSLTFFCRAICHSHNMCHLAYATICFCFFNVLVFFCSPGKYKQQPWQTGVK